jgi:hypothetical protein
MRIEGIRLIEKPTRIWPQNFEVPKLPPEFAPLCKAQRELSSREAFRP